MLCRSAHCARKVENGMSATSNNPLEPGPQAGERINVLVESELEYWSREFGVPRARLAQAIEQVGPAIADLRRVLAN
jgi:hypothetical protein